MFCFTKGGKRDITCHIYLPCSLQICLMLQFHVEKLYFFEIFLRQLSYFRSIVCERFYHVTMKSPIWLIACHHRNYSCCHLPTRGRAGVKLGDVDTSKTYP